MDILAFFHPEGLSAVILLLAMLMMAPITLFSLKFKGFGWKENHIRFVFLGLSLVVAILCLLLIKNIWLAGPIIILLYLLMSLIHNLKHGHEV